MLDSFGRTINYMRVSVTDRCNLRCRYCMPDGIELISMNEILTYEEIIEVCAAGASLGISRLRITGGEPLVRKGCPDLIRALKALPGIERVTMTTNGVLLGEYLPELLAAGLDSVNVSLDTLSRGRYAAITGRDLYENVAESLRAVLASGLPLRINAVLQKGVNDDEWLSLARLAEHRALDVRFIELMPIGYARDIKGVSNSDLIKELTDMYPDLRDDTVLRGSGPAAYYRIPGWKGSLGFISAIHDRFCGRCNRMRLTSTGALKPCLCFGETEQLMPVLRSGAPAQERSAMLRDCIGRAITAKPRQHCFENPENVTEDAPMVSIGG
ncbi:MAG: GTP 3',8-cyclase MoaA [Lachnospiraceae bacterium]|nr:GTP 3',8-cyclase MoaA [Lachnospiraceae bacterium]